MVAAFVSEALGGIFIMVAGLGALAVLFIFTIKRCHDFNTTGWLSILALVPLVSFVFALIPGTKGANNYGPPPSKNTTAIVVGGLLAPLVSIVGVLAAIAIPAYQDYAQRAQIGEVFAQTSAAKVAIAEHAQRAQQWPSAADLDAMGLGEPLEGLYATVYVEPDTGVLR
ncbi:MAG: DUF805 domain-containing protein, partial [Planctomycetota bacterium]